MPAILRSWAPATEPLHFARCPALPADLRHGSSDATQRTVASVQRRGVEACAPLQGPRCSACPARRVE
eukprot:14932385-Alexandrium_andersonii.AAC.1